MLHQLVVLGFWLPPLVIGVVATSVTGRYSLLVTDQVADPVASGGQASGSAALACRSAKTCCFNICWCIRKVVGQASAQKSWTSHGHGCAVKTSTRACTLHATLTTWRTAYEGGGRCARVLAACHAGTAKC